MTEITLKEFFFGRTLKTSQPKWHAWGMFFMALFWLSLSLLFIVPLVLGALEHGIPDKPLSTWPVFLASLLLFPGLAIACAVPLSRMRSSYAFSDRCLRQIFRNGKERIIALKDIARVHSRWQGNIDVVISSSGTRIVVSDGLPEYLCIRNFCFAAAELNRLGATGERLIDLLTSALGAHGQIAFREHRDAIGALIALVAVTALGLPMMWFSLFPDDPEETWWRLLLFLMGAFFLSIAVASIWQMLKYQREVIALRQDGLDHVDGRGAERSVTWSQISEVVHPGTECPGLCLIGADGSKLTTISVEFRELCAIAYFIEHMRGGLTTEKP